MTKTQYYTATSIDGFIADADNSLDWLFEAASNGIEDTRFGRFFAGQLWDVYGPDRSHA